MKVGCPAIPKFPEVDKPFFLGQFVILLLSETTAR